MPAFTEALSPALKSERLLSTMVEDHGPGPPASSGRSLESTGPGGGRDLILSVELLQTQAPPSSSPLSWGQQVGGKQWGDAGNGKAAGEGGGRAPQSGAGTWGQMLGFPGGSDSKDSICNAGASGDVGLIPESGKSPREGNGNPLQCSCLENLMHRGAWQATVFGVARELDMT